MQQISASKEHEFCEANQASDRTAENVSYILGHRGTPNNHNRILHIIWLSTTNSGYNNSIRCKIPWKSLMTEGTCSNKISEIRVRISVIYWMQWWFVLTTSRIMHRTEGWNQNKIIQFKIKKKCEKASYKNKMEFQSVDYHISACSARNVHEVKTITDTIKHRPGIWHQHERS